MARLESIPLLTVAVFAAGVFAPGAAAQSAAAPSPVLAPAAAPTGDRPAPKRTRAISGDVAAALAAAAPKYTPPPPKPAPKPESELVDIREVDKPKNTIVRLPKYIVTEPKPAVLSERAVHTEKGLADIAMRRYISEMDRALNRWTIPFIGASPESRALAMYAEDERLKNMADLRDAADNASKTDAAAGDYIRRESRETFLRTSDFGWNGGGPK